MADNLIEGLISARISPVRAYRRQQYSCFLPKFIQKATKRVSVSPIGRMEQPKSFNSVAASVQPLEASTMSRFDNTLPSKEVLEAVAEWTTGAMNGSVLFEEALAARLSLFNPSLAQVQDFLEKRPPRISPGLDELIKQLRDNGTSIYLVSGGFRQMINPIASILGIPLENIFANKLLFLSSGEFLGFDTNEPTSRSGGKATAVQHIRTAHGYQSLIMIGDDATDLEARQPGGADLFICYGGVQLRETVAAKADWLVFKFRDLINSLE
ncbi:unnamed protein product [Ilex paraguariensis]|uniref:phosphoserine phosphatase n=1 Tax=Ilex paraguariensis TaxID=185542 RepID=A0ABC8RTB1_9AQUA